MRALRRTGHVALLPATRTQLPVSSVLHLQGWDIASAWRPVGQIATGVHLLCPDMHDNRHAQAAFAVLAAASTASG